MKHKLTLAFTILALIVSAYFFHDSSSLGYLISGISLSYLIILILGSSFIQLNYFVKSINKGVEKGISITFDDGPDSIVTPKILDILAQENIKATFFVIGHKLKENKDLLLRIHSEGHIIGNHSFAHTNQLTISSSSTLKEDFLHCSNSIKKITGQNPLFFRPPFGITNPKYFRVLETLKLTSIGWSIRSLDTKTTNENNLFKKVTKNIVDGSIILFHDTQTVTVEVLPRIITHCKNNGINIVSLPELINKEPYA